MKHLALLLALVILTSGCVGNVVQQVPAPEAKTREVSFRTDDGFTIYGTYYENTGPAIILVHMLNRDRHTWDKFAGELQDNGYAVLSFDSRGHGQSTRQGGSERLWIDFSYDDFRDMEMDLKAAHSFLNGMGSERVSIIGASIGANTALVYSDNNEDIDSLVLLSPGLNYRTVSTANIQNPLPTLLVAGEKDPPAMEGVNVIKANSPESQVKLYPGQLHGTEILEGTDLDTVILDFIGNDYA